MNPSIEAFADELEKIAVSAGWVNGKLQGMAGKISAMPDAQRAPRRMMENRLQNVVARGNARNAFNPAPKIPERLVTKPTHPQYQAAMAAHGQATAKSNAFRQGITDIAHANGSSVPVGM
jgi:hypothetical protein